MKKSSLIFGALVLSLSFSCKKKLEEIASLDPFDGFTCDHIVTNNLTGTEFTSLLQNGTSSATVYRLCIANDVKINDQANSTLTISATNIEIRGGNARTATLSNVSITASTSSNLVKLINVKVNNDSNNTPLRISGTASVIIESTTVTEDGTMDAALIAGNNATVTVSAATVVSNDNHGIRAIAQNGASTNITVKRSTITAKASGLFLLSQNTSTVIGTVDGNTFKTVAAAGGMDQPYGITSLAQNTSLITLNDVSTSPLHLFCNGATTAVNMTSVYDQISQNSSTINGNFNFNNTQNGSNTNISTCP